LAFRLCNLLGGSIRYSFRRHSLDDPSFCKEFLMVEGPRAAFSVCEETESLLDRLESKQALLVRADFRWQIRSLIADRRATAAERDNLLNLYYYLMDHLELRSQDDRSQCLYLQCGRTADGILFAIAETMAGGGHFDTDLFRAVLAREVEVGRLIVDGRFQCILARLYRWAR
jgi:hypothetical protein